MPKYRISVISLIMAISLAIALMCTACSQQDKASGLANKEARGDESGTEAVAGLDNNEVVGNTTDLGSETADPVSVIADNESDVVADGSLNIEDLKNSGLNVITEQSFDVELENFGQVTFVSGSIEEDGLYKLKLCLIDGNGKVLYEFPDFYGNNWPMFFEVWSVAFDDLNGDGLKDVVAIASFMTGAGPTGAEEFPVAGVYFQHGKEFVSIPWLDEEIIENVTEVNISNVSDYIKKVDKEKLSKYINGGSGDESGITSSLETWVGDYTFSEYAPPDQNMLYSISIYNEENAYYADIYIDGFQTMERLRAKVIDDKNSVKLVFESYLPDNQFELFEAGDILLSFEKSGSELLTNWAGIEPMVVDNNVSGKVYFQKE